MKFSLAAVSALLVAATATAATPQLRGLKVNNDLPDTCKTSAECTKFCTGGSCPIYDCKDGQCEERECKDSSECVIFCPGGDCPPMMCDEGVCVEGEEDEDPPAPGDECKIDSDCEGVDMCTGGDCPSYTCEDGTCVEDVKPECDNDADCNAGVLCPGGECPQRTCDNGTCVGEEVVIPPQPCGEGNTCERGEVCCNLSCGICVPQGETCDTAQVCEFCKTAKDCSNVLANCVNGLCEVAEIPVQMSFGAFGQLP